MLHVCGAESSGGQDEVSSHNPARLAFTPSGSVPEEHKFSGFAGQRLCKEWQASTQACFIASTIASHSTAVAICTSLGCVICSLALRDAVKHGLVESAQLNLSFGVVVGHNLTYAWSQS